MAKKLVFVTGMPRAMTTLMCNVLANDPRIGGGETSPLLEYVYGARANYSTTPEVKSAQTEEVMHQSFLNFCRQGMLGYAEKATPKEIYLDKSRGWVHYNEFLWEFMPEAKIILMVRDIRSVLSSFEKKWRENPSIIDQRDIPSKQMFITIDQRVNHWLSDPPLGLALKRIFNAYQTGTLKKMLIVRAEEFCKKPKEMMQKVYDFIGEPYFELDYNNIQQVTVENDRVSDFGIYGDHKIRPNIQPLQKDYNELLTPQIASSVKANFQWFYEEFSYL